jgi:hypothetical protein
MGPFLLAYNLLAILLYYYTVVKIQFVKSPTFGSTCQIICRGVESSHRRGVQVFSTFSPWRLSARALPTDYN